MRWDRVQQRWQRMSTTVRSTWSELTSDDLEEVNGSRGLLATLIHERYGLPTDEAERQIDVWLTSQ